MAQTLNFSAKGEFITKLARETFLYNHKLGKAVDIIAARCSTTESDTMTDAEHLMLCLEILSGKKDIVGTYPNDDYGIKENKNINFSWLEFLKSTDAIQDEMQNIKDELQKQYKKLSIIFNEMQEWELKRVARRYYEETGEHLFNEEAKIIDNKFIEFISDMPDEDETANSAVDLYLSRVTDESKHKFADYGWLEPNGTYHEVEWGDHATWAHEYCEKHYPYEEYANMYNKADANGQTHYYVNGDFLVYVLGWVLLDAPSLGLATPRYDIRKGLTKAQKEFLYDYYIERNRHDEANELYQDD